MSFYPAQHLKDRLTGLWQRGSDSLLSLRDCLLNRALHPGLSADLFQSGGAGLFGSTEEFVSRLSSPFMYWLLY